MPCIFSVLFFLIFSVTTIEARAQSFNAIKSVDMGDPVPANESYQLIDLDLKKLKTPGVSGRVILRQFPNRVRLEFEGSRLPRGTYIVATADACGAARGDWKERHRFVSDMTHIATEKSLPSETLAGFKGKAVLLARLGVASAWDRVDCKPIP